MARTRREDARRAATAERHRRGRNVWWRRGLRIVRRAAGGILTRWCLPALLRGLAWTWRVERIDFERFTAALHGDGFLIALWHGDMLAPLPLHRNLPVSVLVSPSGDGALIKTVLERYGLEVVRGSTSRGSARALRELRQHLGRARGVVITPDGPRGPRHEMNLGLAWLARETGCPILPLRVECDRAWRLRSWDRFLVPKPWARIAIHYGEPLLVPATADDSGLESCAAGLRTALLPEIAPDHRR